MNPVQAAQESGDGRHRRYEIGKCSTHPTVSFLKPGNVHLATEENAAKRGRDEPRTEKRAIWIVHGMGQQVPFETLDSLVEGVLLGAARNRDGWQISGPPRVVTAKFLDSDNGSKPQVVQRVEIDLEQRAEFGDQRGTANPPKLQLHLYEAYWAPLTEGVAKVTDVISFLFNAGIHGLLNWLRPFRRAMFPDDESSCHPE